MALILMFDFTRELALMAKAKVILVEVLVEVYGMVTSLKLPECFKHVIMQYYHKFDKLYQMPSHF